MQSSEEDWLQTFCMTKNTFLYRCSEIEEGLHPPPSLLVPREPISAREQIAICIYYLASGVAFRVVADVFGICK